MRFVRDHYYKLERDSRWSLLKYVRKTFIKIPEFTIYLHGKSVPVPAHIRPEYLFLRLAGSNKHMPIRAQNIYSRILVETAKTSFDVQEVPKSDLLLYIGKNTTKHFEEELKGAIIKRRLKRRTSMTKDKYGTSLNANCARNAANRTQRATAITNDSPNAEVRLLKS